MSPEYIFVVRVDAADEEQADQVETALSMIKGVSEVRLNETLLMPVDNHTTELYLYKLRSPKAPPVVSSRWLRGELPGLTKSDLKNWIKEGFIEPSLPYPGRGCSRLFTRDEAKTVGQLWYAKVRGIPARMALQVIDPAFQG